MSSKRLDVQGIRAWAVIAVIVFHFASVILPWGYLGVDVFFVLSGFLISMVLERKPFLFATYADFYFKRFKRIFPLALLIALANLIVISQNDELKLVKIETRSALFAVLFLKNFNEGDEGADYFAALENANDYFTHYWSLSVEIQFYIVAPFLLHILKPSQSRPTLMLIYLSSISLLSFALFTYLPSDISFSSTLCRLWQFFAGSIAFNLSDMKILASNLGDNVDVAPISSPICARRTIGRYEIPLAAMFLASAIVLFLGEWISLSRLFITMFAAFLIFYESSSPILCHMVLQLLGDASYALYLVHWPVVCLLKQCYLDDEPLVVIASIIACIAISLLLHVSFEKWYLSLSEYRIFALISVLYLLCFSLIYYNDMRKPPKTLPGEFNPSEALLEWKVGSLMNFTDEEVMKMNKYMDVHASEKLMFHNCTNAEAEYSSRIPLCSFPNGRGNLSFLMIGNSYAFSTGALVRQHFIDHYERMFARSVPWCEPLIETNRNNIHEIHKLFLDDVKRENPDVLFISTRYENPDVPIRLNVASDPLYLYMMNKLSEYEQYVTTKVFILDSFPLLHNPRRAEMKRRWKGLSIEEFMTESIKADDAPMRLRTREIAKSCRKCVVYDIRIPHLNEQGQFMTADPKSHLRYFDNTIHYTSVGVKLIEPVFSELSKQFDRLLNATFPENLFELKH